MDLGQLLAERAPTILAEAVQVLSRARLRHYEASGAEQNRERLARLLALTQECVRSRAVVPMVEYAARVADERFAAGFDIQEVQAGFNALEEVVWRHITDALPPQEYPHAFGLASTVLGAGKEALAAQYVALASRRHAPALDLPALLEGRWVLESVA